MDNYEFVSISNLSARFFWRFLDLRPIKEDFGKETLVLGYSIERWNKNNGSWFAKGRQLTDNESKISNDRPGINKRRCRVSLHWPLMKASDDEGHAGRQAPPPVASPATRAVSCCSDGHRCGDQLWLAALRLLLGGGSGGFCGGGRRFGFSRVAPATADGRSRFSALARVISLPFHRGWILPLFVVVVVVVVTVVVGVAVVVGFYSFRGGEFSVRIDSILAISFPLDLFGWNLLNLFNSN